MPEESKAPAPAAPAAPATQPWDQPCVKSQERRTAGAGALAMFVLSAISIYAFYEVAKIASSDLGVSVWSSQENLKARLTPVATELLTRQALSGGIAADGLSQRIVPGDKRWESVSGITGILTDDGAKNRLVSLWAKRIEHDHTQSLVRAYLTGLDAAGAAVERDQVVATLVKDHSDGLISAISAWVNDELSMLKIYAALEEQGEHVAPIRRRRPNGAHRRALLRLCLCQRRSSTVFGSRQPGICMTSWVKRR